MTYTRSLMLVGAPLIAVAALGVSRPRLEAATSHPQTVQAPRFEVDPMWPKPMPNRWILGSSVGVAVDSHDHIFVINLTNSFNARTESGSGQNPPSGECCTPAPAVLEFDPDGNLVGHWGGPGPGYDWPSANHGIAVDSKDNVWIGGSGGFDSQILKFSRDGKFLAAYGKATPMTAAAPAAAADTAYGGAGGATGGATGGGRGGRGGRGRGAAGPLPSAKPNSNSMESFGGPAGISFDEKSNEAFVADGYRNRRVAVLDMTSGAIKRYWGAYGSPPDDAVPVSYVPGGTGAKQFGAPVRCAEVSKDGLVYVCDRANDRIQVFKKDGSFVKEAVINPNTRGEGSVWDVAFSRDPQQKFMYVADGADDRVFILDRQSLAVLSSFGDGGRVPGEFYAVHSVATDSKGNVYTVETYEGKRLQKFNFKGVGAVPPNQAVVWPGAKR